MSSNHTNRLCVDAQSLEQSRKESRIKRWMILGRAISRDTLREVLGRLKGNNPRHPIFEPRMRVSDTLRDQSHPFDGAFDMIARMKEDGGSHYDVRVFAAKTFVGFVDSIYADERVNLETLAPRFLKEAGEATAAQYAAALHPCPANNDYALNETTELVNIAEITQRTLAANSKRHLQLERR